MSTITDGIVPLKINCSSTLTKEQLDALNGIELMSMAVFGVSIVNFEYKFKIYQIDGDIVLLKQISKKGGEASPPVKPMKLKTPRSAGYQVARCLVGCDICKTSDQYDSNDMLEPTYLINTKNGDCGRPLLYFEPTYREHWLLGVHHWGGSKINSADIFTKNVPLLDLYSGYKPESCDIEAVLPGNPATITSKFIPDPLANLIPEGWVDRSKYELKEMSMQNVMKGLNKYNKHRNWNVKELDCFDKAFNILTQKFSPYMEHISIPDRYEDWFYVMLHGGQSILKHSSPGYPFNQVEYDKVNWLKHYGKTLWEEILNRNVLNVPCYFTFSPKDEVRAITKDQRMFCGAPIHHTGVGVYLFYSISDVAKSLRMDYSRPFRYGMNLNEMSVHFSNIFDKTPYGHSWDVDGCDTSIPSSFIELIFAWIRTYFPDDLHDLFDWYVQEMLYSYMKAPDLSVWLKDMGNPSGHYLTTLLNSLWSCFIWCVTYVRIMDSKLIPDYMADPYRYMVGHVFDNFTGDDALITFQHEPYFTKTEISKTLPPDVSITFDSPECELSNLYQVTFLSLRIVPKAEMPKQYRHIQFPISHAKPDRCLVKMLYKKKEHDHTIFYQKVCNFLGYVLFDEVWFNRIGGLKKSVEKFFFDHNLKFRYMSVAEIESVRGVLTEELLKITNFTFIEQSGMHLNNFSHFKSMNSDARGKNYERNRRQKENRKKRNKEVKREQSIKIVQTTPKIKPKRKTARQKKAYAVDEFYGSAFLSKSGEEKYKGILGFPKTSPSKFPQTLADAAVSLTAPWVNENVRPMPMACGSKHVSTCCMQGDQLNVYNGANGASSLRSWVIQTHNIANPILVTYTATGNTAMTDSTKTADTVNAQLAWDIRTPGGQFGLTTNVQNFSNYWLLSLYPQAYGFTSNGQYNSNHVWFFGVQPSASGSYYANFFASAGVGQISAEILLCNAAWNSLTTQGQCNINGEDVEESSISLGALNSGNLYIFAVALNASSSFTPGRISMGISGSAAGTGASQAILLPYDNTGTKLDVSLPVTANSLIGLQYNNWQTLNARTNKLRLNSNAVVLTNTVAEMYAGGNILSGRVESNEPFASSWETYIFGLAKKRLGKLSKGGCGMQFTSGRNMGFLNVAQMPNNSFVEEGIATNMYLLTNTAVNGATNNSLSIQVKYSGHVDYVTDDVTITRYALTPYNNQCATYIGMLSMAYQFTDNPLHEDFIKAIRNGVAWLMSDAPAAMVTRNALKGVGKAAGSLAATALAAL